MKFIEELANTLSDIAGGVTWSEIALTVAQALPWANAEDKAMLLRWIKGREISTDRIALQVFAVLTHNQGN
jgi:hypothetical protein